MTTLAHQTDVRSSEIAPYAALLIGAIAMGVSPIFVRLADVGPYASAFWRVAAALPALWAWQAIEGHGDGRRLGLTPAVMLAGAFFAADLFFWHLAITHTTVANATFFATTAPVWVVIGSTLVFRERIASSTLLGLALALAGGGALISESLSVDPARLDGDAFGVVTAIFFGAYFLAVARARHTHGGARLLWLSSLVSVLLLFAAAVFLDDRLLPQTASGVAAIAALALISHAGGQGMLAFALGHLPATFSSLVIFIEAIAAAVLGWLILGEALSAIQIAGGLVILIGIFVARPRAPSLEART